MNGPVLTEACSPYQGRHDLNDPVALWEIIGRLTPDELQSLAISFAINDPVGFESKLLRLWAERP